MDWLKKKKKKKEKEEEKQRLVRGRARGAMLLEDLIKCCDGKSNPIKFFSADQIIKATNNFSHSNRIDVSGLYDYIYKWYSGKIDNHHMIFLLSRRGYCRDIAISSMVSGHKNFMKLLGCCLELEEPVVVYNYMEISNLDLKMVASWEKRIKIAEDIATVLAYLHTAFPRPFVYRAMSPDSIFLGEDGVARLCDFSCCISIPQGETFVQVDKLADYSNARTNRVSEKTDVFAIGIFMQTLLAGAERLCELGLERQLETRNEDDDSDGEGDGDGDAESDETKPEINIPRRKIPRCLSKSMEELRMDEFVDPLMLEKFDEVGEEELCQIKAFRILSLRCIGLEGKVPSMVEVAKELKKIQRSLKNASFSFPAGETKVDISSSVLIPNQTANTKA